VNREISFWDSFFGLIQILNPDYALGIVIACPGLCREELKLQENQVVWRLKHSTAMVKSKTAAKRLILK